MKFSIHPFRGLAGCCHLLVEQDAREAVLLDTGLVGEVGEIGRVLRGLGLDFSSLRAIVLTHGHLDHTGNLARLVELSGAPVYAHPAEQAHIDGTYPYRGWARVCGAMEAFGRAVLRYRRVSITHFLEDGMELPFWGGLRVVHLPGHTAGHCGFYSARHDLLFSGDLFASYGFSVHAPPRFLNSEPALLPESLAKAAALDPRRIVPNHYDRLDGTLHRRRFDKLRCAPVGAKRWRVGLIVSTFLFSVLAAVSLPVCLIVAGMSFDDPREAGVPFVNPGTAPILAFPFVLLGGQGVAWLGYAANKRLLIVLGIVISLAPLIALFHL